MVRLGWSVWVLVSVVVVLGAVALNEGEGCDVWVSNTGNDTTGNTHPDLPFLTINAATRFGLSPALNLQKLTICLQPGEYVESITLPSFRNLSYVMIAGLDPHVRTRLSIHLSGSATTLILKNLTSTGLDVGESTHLALLNSLTLENVRYDCQKAYSEAESWQLYVTNVTLRGVRISNCSKGDVFIFHQKQVGVPGGVCEIDGLVMENSHFVYGFQVAWAKVITLRNSLILNNTAENSLLDFSFAPVAPYIELSNVSFSFNSWDDGSGLVLPPPHGTLALMNIKQDCNINRPAHAHNPLFGYTQATRIVSNISVSPACPIDCNGTSFPEYNLFPCSTCVAGFVPSENNASCAPCPSGSFSKHSLVCFPCPYYSSQPDEGQDHCLCLNFLMVSQPNSHHCSYTIFTLSFGILFGAGLLLASIWAITRRPWWLDYTPVPILEIDNNHD